MKMRLPKWKLRKEEAAYIAGLIDGEGSILCYKSGRSYTKRITISNTRKELMEWLMKKIPFGKFQKKPHPEKPNWSDSYIFYIGKTEYIVWLLEQVLPYLVIKKQLAILMLELCRSRMEKPQFSEYSEKEIQLLEEICRLNSRGTGGKQNGRF